MDEFTVIPALDLKGDAVVHAKSGNRADYRPIESPYGAADYLFAIARGLLSYTASPSLDIAIFTPSPASAIISSWSAG